MTWTATFTNPERVIDGAPNGASETVSITRFGISRQFQEVSICGCIIEGNDDGDVLDLYLDETDSDNPIQLNSTFLLQRTVSGVTRVFFRGYVREKPQRRDSGENAIEVVCWGNEGVLTEALCVDAAGNDIWSLATSTHEVTDMVLQATSAWNTVQGDTLWPDPDTADGAKAYLKDASSNTDLLSEQILIGAGAPFDVKLSITNNNFVPRGWLKIGTEWMYYDGYDNDTGGIYKCHVTARAQLDTIAAQHNVNDDVYSKIAKQIGPENITFEHDDGGGFEKKRRGKQFGVNTETGFFLLPDAAAGDYRATYSIYDEDKTYSGASTVITLSNVIDTLMTGPVANGGPGFVSGDLNMPDFAGIKINRYDYDPQTKPLYVWLAIQDLIRSVGLEDTLEFWYKHFDDEFRGKIIENEAASVTVPFVNRLDGPLVIDDVYSAVRVEYTDDGDLNLANATNSWHQQATGVADIPDKYESASADSPDFEFFNSAEHNAAGNGGMEFTVDGKVETKLGMVFSHNPAQVVSNDFGHYWFGDGATPPTIDLDNIEIKINNYRVVDTAWQPVQNSSETYVMKVQGATDYNSTTHTTALGWQDLGCFMEARPSVNGKWVAGKWNTFLVRRINAIRVAWDYMSGPKQPTAYYGVVHDLTVRGNQVKYVYIELGTTGDEGDSTKVVAPATYRKLRGGIQASGGTAGAPKVKHERIGTSSDGAAISLGRTILKQNLVLYEKRQYEYRGALPVMPELGLTISVVESDTVTYTGVLRSLFLAVDNNEVLVTGEVLDYNAAVLT